MRAARGRLRRADPGLGEVREHRPVPGDGRGPVDRLRRRDRHRRRGAPERRGHREDGGALVPAAGGPPDPRLGDVERYVDRHVHGHDVRYVHRYVHRYVVRHLLRYDVGYDIRYHVHRRYRRLRLHGRADRDELLAGRLPGRRHGHRRDGADQLDGHPHRRHRHAGLERHRRDEPGRQRRHPQRPLEQRPCRRHLDHRRLPGVRFPVPGPDRHLLHAVSPA
ncbi:hypothetical protein SBRY_10211 [Actinacidiphila bryophytorum]|uniref:Uncharacterized protein n=1 Tax=Actinacidiphila bryophytorum TaxID=1436133 RepID=A0A9W4E5F5_9ACTN|nr:hypothetical protein SBRY_10211 [Actinacidiphila bryophytorum]